MSQFLITFKEPKVFKNLLLTLTNGLKSSKKKKIGPKLIFSIFILILTPKLPPIETLWCKNHENKSNQKSHSWAPLRKI
jgi:hypothetical protein